MMQHLVRQQKKGLMSIGKKSAMQTHTILSFLLYIQKVRNVYGWASFVLKRLPPFFVLQKADFRDHIRYAPILLKMFKQYLARLTKLTQNNVVAVLSNFITLIFDGQTTIDAHNVGLFSTYNSSNCNGFESVCLSMLFKMNETTQTADQHHEFLSYSLGVSDKGFDNVIALIAENCSTNRSITNRLRKLLVDCSSQLFQFAARDIISDDQEIIERVHLLMVKLRTPLFRAKLYKETLRRAKLSNNTR